jgi:hypothetical protein
VESGMPVFFNHHNPPPALREQCRCRGPSRAATDD